MFISPIKKCSIYSFVMWDSSPLLKLWIATRTAGYFSVGGLEETGFVCISCIFCLKQVWFLFAVVWFLFAAATNYSVQRWIVFSNCYLLAATILFAACLLRAIVENCCYTRKWGPLQYSLVFISVSPLPWQNSFEFRARQRGCVHTKWDLLLHWHVIYLILWWERFVLPFKLTNADCSKCGSVLPGLFHAVNFILTIPHVT